MKGTIVGNTISLLGADGKQYGPYKLRDDYDKFQLPWETLINKRAELLVDPSSFRYNTPPIKDFVEFESSNPDIESLRLALKTIV